MVSEKEEIDTQIKTNDKPKTITAKTITDTIKVEKIKIKIIVETQEGAAEEITIEKEAISIGATIRTAGTIPEVPTRITPLRETSKMIDR